MTQANFEACLAFTLKYEGGRSNDAHDPGGRTMEGVTQATYDHYQEMKALGRKDVFTMSGAERDEIYRNEYWNTIKGDSLRSGEDLCVFDFAVNSGPVRARDVWARIGPCTVEDMIHRLCAHRLSFLHALRTWRYFGAGWGRRVAACEAIALRMAYGKAAPDVLARKAAKAKFHSGKKTNQAVIGTAAAGGAAGAQHAHMATGMMLAAVAVIVVLAGVFFFHAWRQSQRAAALAAEAKK